LGVIAADWSEQLWHLKQDVLGPILSEG